MLREARALDSQGHGDSALETLNALLVTDPKNIQAYTLQGKILTEMKRWDEARKTYEAVQQIDKGNVVAQFDLAELKFIQKDYSGARPGFESLEHDPDLGDLALYKVFLCDLFGGQEAIAHDELDHFDEVGAKPSYFFANVAWDAVHKQPEEAGGWLKKGEGLYSPDKTSLYAFSLEQLGYLPLPAPKATP